jgi:hypothetical protein
MWLAPALLLGLLSIGLPLWLHRFARQTQIRQPFASLMLIEPGEVQRSRRHQLLYWLLLALRIALLLAVVLALAGPLWPRKPDALPGGQAALHLIVLDTSLSMHRSGVWPAAQTRATAVIDALRGGDRGMLVAADHRLRVLQEPVFPQDGDKLRAALADLTPGQSQLDYGSLMGSASSLTSGAGQPVVLHLITDLQASASPLRFADLQPPAGATLDLIDVGREAAPGLQIEAVMLSPRDATSLDVRLGGDAAALARRELRVVIDGVERGRRTLDGARSLPYAESFTLADLGEGEHRITAQLLPPDELPQDDAHYALLRRIEPRVLVVVADTAANDASYLRAALSALEAPRLRVEVVTPAGLQRRALTDYAAVVVSDAGILPAQTATTLQRYASNGGAVLLTLGERSLAQKLVPVSGAGVGREGLRGSAATAIRVAQVEQSHPVLREAGDWRAIRFFRHVRVVPRDSDAVLLRLEGGDPLLLEQRLGSGRVMTLASQLDRGWNDLAIHPQFVRFIAEATVYLSGSHAAALTARVGSLVTQSLGGRNGAQLFAPDGRRALLLDGTAGELRLVPEQAGFYELRGGGRSEWIAVNTDPRESDLRRLEPPQLAQWRALRAPQPVAAQGEPTTRTAAATVSWLPLWFGLLLAAAVLALCEAVVANYHLGVKRERAA